MVGISHKTWKCSETCLPFEETEAWSLITFVDVQVVLEPQDRGLPNI
jgi:hypothetical protein